MRSLRLTHQEWSLLHLKPLFKVDNQGRTVILRGVSESSTVKKFSLEEQRAEETEQEWPQWKRRDYNESNNVLMFCDQPLGSKTCS